MNVFLVIQLPATMGKKEGRSGNPFDFMSHRGSNWLKELNLLRQALWQLATPAAYNTGNGSSDDHEEFSDPGKGKKSYHRHTSQQIQQLEAFFKECPHPDENQRRQLSRELGLEAKQIKFWFQNKRTQTKAQNERADNNGLRAENERIHCENLAFGEALKNVICPACGDHPPLGEEEKQLNLQKLRMENSRLKEQHERLSNLITSMTGKPISLLLDSLGYSSHSPAENFFAQGSGSSFLDPDAVFRNLRNPTSPYGSNGIGEMDKSILVETASRALDELLELLRVNEPLWAKSQTDGKYVLNHERYTKMFPKSSHLKRSSAHVESSKDSTVVPVNALDLVEMFLDMNKWVDLFPTIVVKARIVETQDTGSLGGSLHLMYEKMHILSPLVAPREFLFLRYCQQVDPSTWVIVDASCDCFREIQETPHTRSWRRPSGSMIQSLPNGNSKVTWVEHNEVNDKSLNHQLYRDLMSGAQAYGAARWVSTLQRICERSMYSAISSTTSHELEGVINLPGGRRNIMKLSHRMVKNLCAILSMPDRLDFPQFLELTNSGVRISIRKNSEPCQPHGMIIAAATSQWLPLPFEVLFNFLRDENKRPQWDMMSNGCPVNEIAHLSTGNHPGNYVSLIQPFVSTQSSMLLLQENSIDSLGALVIFAPIDLPAIMATLSCEDTMKIPVLPSGFLISSDGRSNGKGISGASTSTSTVSRQVGSLLTFAFQILVQSDSAPRQFVMESITTLNTLITSTIQRIKVALDCTDLD